ncbi:MAG: hypothetical protein NTV32_07170 [Gammaproteobacteria bacterium]|nr:hypothetical protein [Gammaproteobacteria bacterium]
MNLPLGSRVSTEEKTLLASVGFDMSTLSERRGGFFIQFPEAHRNLQISVAHPDFDKNNFSVKYNGVEIISVSEKASLYDYYAFSRIDKDAIAAALAIPETNLASSSSIGAQPVAATAPRAREGGRVEALTLMSAIAASRARDPKGPGADDEKCIIM